MGHYLRRATTELRQASPYFDPEYYLQHNPGVRKATIPPLLHYVRHGAEEGRKPHPLFQPEYYARCGFGIEIGTSRLLAHFAESGADAFNPHPLFDCESYLSKYPEAVTQRMNPLAHYLLRRTQTRKIPESQPGAGKLEVARFEIADVPVAVIFPGDAWPREKSCETSTRLPGNVVLVWKDSFGTARIEAEPQQKPFFEAIPFEQLYAQVNSWVRC